MPTSDAERSLRVIYQELASRKGEPDLTERAAERLRHFQSTQSTTRNTHVV